MTKRNTIQFPLQTQYHPQGLVFDDFSAHRKGWIGDRTAPVAVFKFRFSADAIKFAQYLEIDGQETFVASGGTIGGGWWYKGNQFVAQNEPYPFKKVIKAVRSVSGFGDTQDALIALRNDGAKHILIPQLSSTPFYFDSPNPPVLDTALSQPTPSVDWEDIRIFFTVSRQVGAITVESFRSQIYLRKHNPANPTAFTGSFAPPHTSAETFKAYGMKGNVVFDLGTLTVDTSNGNFTLTVPDNDGLLGRVSDYRFPKNINIFRDTDFRDGIQFGVRTVFWDTKSVYISNEGDPFHFGREEGFVPETGDGGIVPLPNVRFVQGWGNMLLAFTDQKVYRIVEVQSGVWGTVETALPPPAPLSVFDENLYRSYQSLVYIQGDETPKMFGKRFQLLAPQFQQMVGFADFGLGRVGRQIWLWLDEDIYEYDQYDYVFRAGNRFFLIKDNSPYLDVYELDLTKWWVDPIKRKSVWQYVFTIPDVFLKRVNIWVDDEMPYSLKIEYQQPAGGWVLGVNMTGVLKQGENRLIPPKRIRGRMFRLTLTLGTDGGIGDYKAIPSVEYTVLERIAGGIGEG